MANSNHPAVQLPKCRHCGSPDVRPAYPNLLDRVIQRLRIQPFRCRRCARRFYLRQAV